MKLLETVEDIREFTGGITRRSKRLQEDIQKALNSVVSLWTRNKIDCLEATQLLTEVQGASPYHQVAVSKWIAEIPGVEWAEDTKRWFGEADLKLSGKVAMPLMKTPFWKVSPPKSVKPMSLVEEIEKVLAKADRHRTKAVEGDQIDWGLVTKLKETIAQAA